MIPGAAGRNDVISLRSVTSVNVGSRRLRCDAELLLLRTRLRRRRKTRMTTISTQNSSTTAPPTTNPTTARTPPRADVTSTTDAMIRQA